MGIQDQAKYSGTPLGRFLDEWLPQRHSIEESWIRELATAPGDLTPSVPGRDDLGWALELRIDLDLTDVPPRTAELSYLPNNRCSALLKATGYEHRSYGVPTANNTTDPLLRHWIRTHHPIAIDTTDREVFVACLDLAGFRQPMHSWGVSRTVDERRSLFASMAKDGDTVGNDAVLPDLLAHSWSVYLDRGRRSLLELGSHVIAAPELACGYGVADLVIGRTLIDVKLAVEPTPKDVSMWLRQLLGYVLLDRHDTFRLDTVGVYCGWSGVLLTYPLSALIAAASPGLRPTLARLRADFYEALRDEIDSYLAWKERTRYF